MYQDYQPPNITTMAISIDTLTKEIKAAFDAEKKQTSDQDASIQRIAAAIAKAVAKQIAAGIDTATVTPVLVAPPAGGAVTGTITIKSNVQ